jgi:undecaprenyl-diphosphatase
VTYTRRWLDAVIFAVGLAVTVVCSLVAATGEVPEWERALFRLVNDQPDWLQVVFYPLQLLGVLVVPVALAVVLVAWKRWWRLGLSLVLIVPAKLIVERQILKALVDRERPAASICAGDLTCGNFRNVPLAFDSFPSGHAVVAGAMLVVLLPYLSRRWGWVLVATALAVGVARVYLGAHNPLDVVGGLAVGAALGGILNLAVGVPRSRPAWTTLPESG